MIDIRDIIDKLPKEQHQQLMFAFNNGLSEYIEYEPGCFIGVNIDLTQYSKFQIIITRGKWSVGTITGDTKNETS